MIEIENVEVYGWKAAIRGMRNPMNSWAKSDSYPDRYDFGGGKTDGLTLGKNDFELMERLAKGGASHAKYRRMITVSLDVVAPLYWWKEYDTYKVGTVANSCSTMHKIHEKEFSVDDFSHEHLLTGSMFQLHRVVDLLNEAREAFLGCGDECRELKKAYWWQMIQLLPSSYNQRRTLLLNYEVLANMYRDRKAHKLDEWREFCRWIKTLPYSELITGKE